MTCDAVFLWLMLSCIISPKLRKPSLHLLCTSLASVLAAMETPQLVPCYKTFHKRASAISEDFNANTVYRKLLMLDQICRELFANVAEVRFFLRHPVVMCQQ